MKTLLNNSFTRSLSLQKLFLKLATYPRFAEWCKVSPVIFISGGPREKRNKLFGKVLKDAQLADVPLVYFEFGVHRGESIAWWVENNLNSSSKFFGFDSFEGLPEDWSPGKQSGYFSTDGKTPMNDNPRLTFVKGWFHNTLREHLHHLESDTQKVIHMDADLYRSTIFPLMNIGPYLREGDILIFDEFLDSIHEFRAFEDFQAIFNFEFKVLGATKEFAQTALQLTNGIRR